MSSILFKHIERFENGDPSKAEAAAKLRKAVTEAEHAGLFERQTPTKSLSERTLLTQSAARAVISALTLPPENPGKLAAQYTDLFRDLAQHHNSHYDKREVYVPISVKPENLPQAQRALASVFTQAPQPHRRLSPWERSNLLTASKILIITRRYSLVDPSALTLSGDRERFVSTDINQGKLGSMLNLRQDQNMELLKNAGFFHSK